jgi:molecular chaperone GrpE (heat shock protein)
VKELVYENIYKQVMDDFKQKALSSKLYDKNKQMEWAAIAVSLNHPEAFPKQLNSLLAEDYNINVSDKQMVDLLDKVNLNNPAKRKQMLDLVKTTAMQIKLLLNGDKKACGYLDNFINGPIQRDDNRIVLKSKCTLTWMILFDETFKDPSLVTLLENCMEPYCSRIIKDIYYKVSRKLGVNSRQNARTVIEQTQAAIEASTVQADYESITDKDKQIEALKFDLNNYKNALEMVQSMFDELKESVDEAANEAKRLAISEFFIKLNSSEYGNILDNLPVVDNNLSQLRKQRIQLPPQVVSLPIIFRQIMKFVKDTGIEPIESVGRVFEARYEDISLYNYNGEPFILDNEVKTVEVSSPGWKFGDIIISTPSVREKE